MKWNEWFDGFDLNEPYGKVPMVRRRCPYESDLSEPNGKVPMSWEWMSLSIWLECYQWESPYVQLNECPYQSDLEQPYEKVPMVGRKCPYQNELNDLNEKVPIKMMRFEWIEWNEVKWGE